MASPEIRVLTPDDEPALERYLVSRPYTTLFFRGNLHEVGGLGADPAQPYGGVYAASLEDGVVTGVATVFWNGSLIVEAYRAVTRIAHEAMAHAREPVRRLLGPAAQVRALRDELGLSAVPTTMDSIEILYALEIPRLRVPADLARGVVRCRRSTPADIERLAAWRYAYMREAIGLPEGAETRRGAREGLERGIARGTSFLLEAEQGIVSMSGFNAWIPDCCQIGGVYTPPELRSRGYGRAVVAGSLQIAAAEGTPRSVLFTAEENAPARRSYQALGYEPVGDYYLFFPEAPYRA